MVDLDIPLFSVNENTDHTISYILEGLSWLLNCFVYLKLFKKQNQNH